jgi:hypothetical protein
LKIRGTSIVLHDIKAQQLLSTNRPFSEPLPRATNSECTIALSKRASRRSQI